MSELIQLEMTLEEARETDRLIKRHINHTRYLLLDMRDRKGWKALGYESFVEYGKKSLGYDKSHIYELADAGEIGLQVGFSAIAENQPKETHLRPLKAVPEEDRKAIWDEATRKAEEEHAKLTAKRVEDEVNTWKKTAKYHQEMADSTQHELALERQRSAEWKEQWKAERDKKAKPPADYETAKATAAKLKEDLAALRKKQDELVQQQVVAKLREREKELADLDRKAKDAEARLQSLNKQIDSYSSIERMTRLQRDQIEKCRSMLAELAANMEGFDRLENDPKTDQLWAALADMLRNGAAAIDFFCGDKKTGLKPELTVIQGGAA